LLVQAFAQDVIDTIDLVELKEDVEEFIDSKFS